MLILTCKCPWFRQVLSRNFIDRVFLFEIIWQSIKKVVPLRTDYVQINEMTDVGLRFWPNKAQARQSIIKLLIKHLTWIL